MAEEDLSSEEQHADADDLQVSYAPRPRRFLLIVGLCVALLVGAVIVARIVFARQPPGAWEKEAWPSGAGPVPVAHYLEATPETFADVVSQVQPGETIMLLPGEYPPMSLVSLNGLPGAPIAIIGDQQAVFQPMLHVHQSSWLILDGLTIDGTALLETGASANMGLSITNSGYCVVRNLTIRNIPGRGVYGNNLHHTIFEDNEISNAQRSHGLSVFGATSDIIIRRNRVHDNAGCGIYLDAYTTPGSAVMRVLAEGNIVARNGATGGAAFNCSNVIASCFRNNLVYKNLAGGICFFRAADDPGMMFLASQRVPASGPRALVTRLIDRLLNRPSPDCANNTVAGNTVYFDEGQGRWSFKLRDESTGFVIHNNIFFGGKFGTVSIAPESLPGLVMDHNLITTHEGQVLLGETFQDDSEPSFAYTVEAWRNMGYGLHSIFNKDPGFTASQEDCFWLKAGSPAIDAGKHLGKWLPNDIDERERPKGRAPDLGAFEFHVP